MENETNKNDIWCFKMCFSLFKSFDLKNNL